MVGGRGVERKEEDKNKGPREGGWCSCSVRHRFFPDLIKRGGYVSGYIEYLFMGTPKKCSLY